jgi:hypothetical protein
VADLLTIEQMFAALRNGRSLPEYLLDKFLKEGTDEQIEEILRRGASKELLKQILQAELANRRHRELTTHLSSVAVGIDRTPFFGPEAMLVSGLLFMV